MAKIRNRFKILLAQKESRDGRNYTYRDIYAETGVSPTTLTAFARDDVSRFDEITLVKLCDWFDCELSDLLVYPPAKSQQGLATAAMVAV